MANHHRLDGDFYAAVLAAICGVVSLVAGIVIRQRTGSLDLGVAAFFVVLSTTTFLSIWLQP